jgi:hypothetical protein
VPNPHQQHHRRWSLGDPQVDEEITRPFHGAEAVAAAREREERQRLAMADAVAGGKNMEDHSTLKEAEKLGFVRDRQGLSVDPNVHEAGVSPLSELVRPPPVAGQEAKGSGQQQQQHYDIGEYRSIYDGVDGGYKISEYKSIYD